MRYKIKRNVSVLCLAMALTSAGAIDIVRYNAERDDRFAPGTYPGAPQVNVNFAHGALDWSGVGWNMEDPRRSVAMISPKHFIAASHFAPSGHLAFVAADGGEVVVEISGTVHRLIDPMSGLMSDLYLGELVEPIPSESGIAHYPVMSLLTADAYLGLPLLVYGHRQGVGGTAAGVAVGVNTFEGFQQELFCEYRFYFDQDHARGEAQAQAGDSGSPTFTAVGSTLVLLGTHNSIGKVGRRPVTYDTFIPNFIDQIQDIIGVQGYSILPVPEQPVDASTTGPRRK